MNETTPTINDIKVNSSTNASEILIQHGNQDSHKETIDTDDKIVNPNTAKEMCGEKRVRLPKREKKRLKRELRKQIRRENRPLKRKKQKQKRNEFLESMSKAERETYFQKQKEKKELQQSRTNEAFEQGTPLVFDLSFCDKMHLGERTSLVKQLLLCYGANKKATHPFQLHFCNFNGDFAAGMREKWNLDNWKVHLHKEKLEHIFDEKLSNVVYLSPDSPNVLNKIESNKIYVVGGLVDGTVEKNCSLDKAQQQIGVQTARLPIKEYITERTTHVLTQCAVLDALLVFRETNCWETAFTKSLPPRMVDPKYKRRKKLD